MALTAGNYVVSLTLQDEQGDKSVQSFEMDAADFAAAQTAAAALVAEYVPITTADIISYSVGLRYDEDSPAYPDGSHVQMKASLTVALEGSTKRANMTVISPSEAIFVNGGVGPSGNTVNIANTDLIAYTDLFKSTATSPLYISDGENLNNMLTGKRTFRNRPK